MINAFCAVAPLRRLIQNAISFLFQSGRVGDAAWGCNWVGAPVSFQRSIMFMISVSKEFKLTAGKIIPVHQGTVMTVRTVFRPACENKDKYSPCVSVYPLIAYVFFMKQKNGNKKRGIFIYMYIIFLSLRESANCVSVMLCYSVSVS
jgi:hypothetical protein